jgi:hypothetical protein
MPALSFINSSLPFDEVKHDFKNHGLIYRDFPNEGLYLLKYNKTKANLSDPNVMMCRGLVVNRDTHDIVAVPPIKSVHYSHFPSVAESGGDYIYEEFIDGSNINVFNFNDKWHISTRSSIGADVSFNSSMTFKDMFFDTLDFNMSDLDKRYCYSFVLIHPNNRIVCNVDTKKLILVEVKEINETSYQTIDLNKVNEQSEFKFNTPNRYAYTFDSEGYSNAITNAIHSPWYEQGVVIKCLKSNVRTKVRSKHYEYVKALKGNSTNLMERFLSLRMQNAIKEYIKYFPESSELFHTYEEYIRTITSNSYHYYIAVFKKKTTTHNSVPTIYKNILYNIHKLYINQNMKPIDFKAVIDFINAKSVDELSTMIEYMESSST